MECQEVRDLYSSLYEGDLKPEEEEKVREHLASCADCQKEWEQFQRTIQWLHTVEEEEVPEGFLSGIQMQLEERKGRERGEERPRFFRSFKIPIQAAAMVMILLVALYLTRMTPFETQEEKAVPKTEISSSTREKKESVSKEEEQTKVPLSPPVSYRKDYVSETKVPASVEKKDASEGVAQQMKEKIVAAPAPLKEETATVKTSPPKEMARMEAPPPEEKRREGDTVGSIRPLAKKSIREITLKTRDREKAISQLQDLAKQLGGEMVREEENVLLASLPGASFAEFERELALIVSAPPVQKPAAPKEMKDNLSLAPGGKSLEPEEKGREALRSMKMIEPVFIRIRIVTE